MSASEAPPPRLYRVVGVSSMTGLWAGLGAIALFVSLVLGVGAARGWNVDAATGVLSFSLVVDPARFWDEPVVTNALDQTLPGRKGPTASGLWYYWRLPPPQQTTLSVALPWIGFLGHILSVWYITFLMQRNGAKYSGDLKGVNVLAMAVNVFFHLLHLGQTHLTYDALAPTVSESASQGSVILVLATILVMEYRARGMWFGYPGPNSTSRFRLAEEPVRFLRMYHGYYFSWAAIWTLWYHPCESTLAHAFGFVHTSMILLQGSLAYTTVHRNQYWRFVVEVWVLAHSTVVAFVVGQGPLWRMFFFGFTAMIVLTQMHGLSVVRSRPWLRFIPTVLYVITVLAVYGSSGKWADLNEVVRIPAILYAFAFILWAITWITLKVRERCVSESGACCGGMGGAARSALGVLGFGACYTLMIVISCVVEMMHVQMDLLVLAGILIFIYACVMPASCVAMDVMVGDKWVARAPGQPVGEEVEQDATTRTEGVPGKKDPPNKPAQRVTPLEAGKMRELEPVGTS